MRTIPTRQVHLDFHTSEFIKNIGVNFNKKDFQETLINGNVNSITVFAKCHHSWCYYPTKIGNIHPHLKFDLLGAMIEAAHEIGIKIPIYITVGWSANDAEKNEDWVVRKKDNSIAVRDYDTNAKPNDYKPEASWKYLCVGTEYANHIQELTKEICENYSVDGIFYDINCGPLCYCKSCIKDMKAKGYDSNNIEDVKTYRIEKWRDFMIKNNSIIREFHENATLFYNDAANHEEPFWLDYQTHFELEDLPTTWGGYDKLPARAKFFSKTNKDYMGMTGKFHTSWGEFGGYKNPDALKYECAYMAAFGAKCSIGDQLHPAGRLDSDTYKIIGKAYNYIKEIEEYSYNTEQTANLGIVFTDNIKSDYDELVDVSKSNAGLQQMLLEKQIDFNIIDKNFSDIFNYHTIILPDMVLLDNDRASIINKYIKNGGNIILTGKSGLKEDKSDFAIDTGNEYIGDSEYNCDYLIAGDEINQNLTKNPVLCYESACKIKAINSSVLSNIVNPLFNRTYEYYSSHRNTPYSEFTSDIPGATINKNITYIAHEIFKIYAIHGAQLHRDYFINILNLSYKKQIIKVDLQSSGRINFVKQPSKNRYILHLLYATPILRGKTLVIEDLPEIYNIPIEINVKETIKNACLAPSKEKIDFKINNNKLTLILPKLKCHQIIIFDY